MATLKDLFVAIYLFAFDLVRSEAGKKESDVDLAFLLACQCYSRRADLYSKNNCSRSMLDEYDLGMCSDA